MIFILHSLSETSSRLINVLMHITQTFFTINPKIVLKEQNGIPCIQLYTFVLVSQGSAHCLLMKAEVFSDWLRLFGNYGLVCKLLCDWLNWELLICDWLNWGMDAHYMYRLWHSKGTHTQLEIKTSRHRFSLGEQRTVSIQNNKLFICLFWCTCS